MRIAVQIEFDKVLDVGSQKAEAILGRAPESDIVVPHNSVSRTHCKIEKTKGGFFITDLNSSNGTFIDGTRLQPNVRTHFKLSSRITLGKLDCEITDGGLSLEQASRSEKLKATIKSNTTQTIKVGRSELLSASSTPLEPQKKNKLQGVRNPVTDNIKVEDPMEDNYFWERKFYILMFLVVAMVVAYMIDLGMK